MSSNKIALIIGAGPAGLTAALELLRKTDIKPIVMEASDVIGGISQTVEFKGNRMDLGGHRFFSKSDRVMDWWKQIMPLQGSPSKDDIWEDRKIPLSEAPDAPDPENEDHVMLFRGRLSRIFFLRKFFDYPITLSPATMTNLGLTRMFRIGMSYLKVRLAPIAGEETLEEFFINRFGKELYLTFFKDYTEKVWGVPCDQITAEWGAQRIKGLSITATLKHAVKAAYKKTRGDQPLDLAQKDVETSLIEQFLYPKLGPGQLWEHVTGMVKELGGEVRMQHRVIGIHQEDRKVTELTVRDEVSGKEYKISGDYVISTMPVKNLIACTNDAPVNVREVANGLMYRDFMTVGLLMSEMKIKQPNGKLVPDNWIYIQERDVKVGRLQVFNNWSPYLVAEDNKAWLGMEYFVQEGDELWTMDDDAFIKFAVDELAKIDIIEADKVEESVVVRVPKAYPAYFGTYDRFHEIRKFTDNILNLFLVGRNGMHRYNNQDHSMLAAMAAVDNIIQGRFSKENVWTVNTETEYHESK